MCDHDSTVWVHFYLLDILMLCWICALNSCICGSEGEEDRRASPSIMSRWVVSVRLGIMLGMWFFAEVYIILLNRSLPVLQEESNPKRTKDSSASRVYEFQSAFLWLVKLR